MDKKVYDVSFSDMVNNLGKRVSRNDDLALIEFDDYDYQKIKEWLTKNRLSGNIEFLRSKNQGQFCCLLEGSISLEVNRRRYDLQAGEGCCMLEGDYFRLLDASKDSRWFVIISRSGDSMMYGINNALLLMSFKNKLDSKRCFKMKEKIARIIFTLYGLMRETLDDRELSYREAIIRNYMHIMFYHMCSDFFDEESYPDMPVPSRRDELLLQFTKMVSENYKEHRKVSYYADKMCLTPKYLSTIVYEVGGRYARDIIAEFVICEAKRCLLNTSMTVQEISDYLHFSCQSFFGKYFREHTGMSPQAYRQSPNQILEERGV